MLGFPPAGGVPALRAVASGLVRESTRRSQDSSCNTPAGRPIGTRPLWLLLVACVLATASCGAHRRTPPLPAAGTGSGLAAEISLSMGGAPVSGKVTALTDEEVTFLPAPYWGTSSRVIRLDEIRQVRVEHPGQASRAFVYSFATGFTVIGFLAGASAEYNDDYSAAMASAAVAGLGIGLLGALIGSQTSTTTYDFRDMSREEQRRLLVRLMAR